MGIAGLPVFATGIRPAYLLGPTGGYLLAFPAAAFVAGVVTRPAGPAAS
jgi:biotin transport system substrate-specific component